MEAEVAAESTQQPKRRPAEAVMPVATEAMAVVGAPTRKVNNTKQPVPVLLFTKSTRPVERNVKNHQPKKNEKPPKLLPSFSVDYYFFFKYFI